jgi:hypothetical protein
MGAAVVMLWLEGIAPDRLRSLPTTQAIAAAGIDARLVPLPLAESANCYFQTLTGIGSGKLGRFDSVRPIAYRPRPVVGVPEGAWQRQLPDLVAASRSTSDLLEVDADDVSTAITATSVDCLIIRMRNADRASDDALGDAIHQCAKRAGDANHIILLSDSWEPAPRRLVNISTFLNEAGVLATVPESGTIGEIAWPETLAYGLGEGQVWLNVRGREPKGVVEPGQEFDEIRTALIDVLRNDWRDPETNEPVVSQVLTREEAYSGEYVFSAPDLVVVFREGFAQSPRARVLELDESSVQNNIQGGAKGGANASAMPHASLIGRGPAFANGRRTNGRLIDVVPSVLYLLGLAIPNRLDGRPIEDLFSAEYRARTPMLLAEHDEPSLSGEDEAVIVGRLQALGYLG